MPKGPYTQPTQPKHSLSIGALTIKGTKLQQQSNLMNLESKLEEVVYELNV